MALNRISTFALHQSTFRNAAFTQSQLANAQIQLSSGRKTQTFDGMSDQAEQFIALEARLSRTNLYKNNNKLVVTRLDTTNAILGQVIDTVTSIKNLIIQRRNDSQAGSLAFPEQLDGLWQSLVGELNTTLEGRYIFSGTRTNIAPVSSTVFPELAESGVPDDNYYFGSSDDITLRADDNIEFTYNVRGNDPGFQKVFAALAMARQGDISNNDSDLATAFDLAAEGLDEIISAQAQVNANKISIEQVIERQTSLSFYWQGLKEEISNTDLVAVSTQVAINEGILQATFQTFSKINSLRLSDFLR
ncbi:MAG: hypothetical protein ACN2B6_07895 [Rickettsiales bacterium]